MNYGVVELIFSAAVVLGLAGWQLLSVSRELARDRREAAAAEKSAVRAGHAVGEHVPHDR